MPIARVVTRIAYKALQDVTSISDNIRHNMTTMVTRLRSLSG